MGYIDQILRGLTRLASGFESLIGLPKGPVVQDDAEEDTQVPKVQDAATTFSSTSETVAARAGSAEHAKAIRALATDLRAAWQSQVGEPVRPQELDLLLSISGVETVWGRGWTDKTDKGQGDMRGSNNFNARQFSGPGAAWRRVEYGDTRPPTAAEVAAGQTANTPIPAPFNYYVDAEGRTAAQNGAWNFVKDLTKTWDSKDALRSGSTVALAHRLGPDRANGGLGYFGGFGTTIAEREGGYANALASRLPEVAAALGRERSVATVAPASGAYANTATGKAQDPSVAGVGEVVHDVGSWLHEGWESLTKWLGFRSLSSAPFDEDGSAGSSVSEKDDYGLSNRRKAALDVVSEVVPSAYGDARFAKLAPAWNPQMAVQSNGAFLTTCGYLPGYVGSKLGLEKNLSSYGTFALRDNARTWGAWIEPGGDARPKPGDAYALADAAGGIVHVGFIVSAPTSGPWKTADAGQGSHEVQTAVYQDRPYDSMLLTLGGPLGPRRLAGWVDLDRVPLAAPRLAGLIAATKGAA